MATGGKRNDSLEQRRNDRENRARGRTGAAGAGGVAGGVDGGDAVPGIDKKLNGPNRPAE